MSEPNDVINIVEDTTIVVNENVCKDKDSDNILNNDKIVYNNVIKRKKDDDNDEVNNENNDENDDEFEYKNRYSFSECIAS